MRRLAIVAVLVIAAAACGEKQGSVSGVPHSGDLHAYVVHTPSGRDIECITLGLGSVGAGLSCDWPSSPSSSPDTTP